MYCFAPRAQVGLSSKSSFASNIADWFSTRTSAVKKGRRRGRMLATCGLRERSQFRGPPPSIGLPQAAAQERNGFILLPVFEVKKEVSIKRRQEGKTDSLQDSASEDRNAD